MELGLSGKVALITGSSKGIGLETALHLVSEGAEVTICARNVENLKVAAKHIFEKTGKEVLYIEADVTKEEDCKRLISSTVEKYGRLDIVVNNAGTSAANPFEEVSTDLWQKDLDLKLFGAIHCSRYAIPYMREGRGRGYCECNSAGSQNTASFFITDYCEPSSRYGAYKSYE